MTERVPYLERVEGPVTVHTDPALRERSGIVIAFSERHGGVSRPPYDSLDLAAHVGDDPIAVDTNRSRLLDALRLGMLRDRLTTADQVHGDSISVVGSSRIGRGAFAEGGSPPLAATDAMLTTATDVPLLMLYADCVPVILIAEEPTPTVAVVHAGWRGALASLPGLAANAVATAAHGATSDLSAYIGPHIGSCCYEVDDRLLSQFVNKFGTIAAVDGHLDLAGVVSASLVTAGVPARHIANVGLCTLDQTDRFYSYRATRATGRHGALAAITEVE